jgi:hypothetical protein
MFNLPEVLADLLSASLREVIRHMLRPYTYPTSGRNEIALFTYIATFNLPEV